MFIKQHIKTTIKSMNKISLVTLNLHKAYTIRKYHYYHYFIRTLRWEKYFFETSCVCGSNCTKYVKNNSEIIAIKSFILVDKIKWKECFLPKFI